MDRAGSPSALIRLPAPPPATDSNGSSEIGDGFGFRRSRGSLAAVPAFTPVDGQTILRHPSITQVVVRGRGPDTLRRDRSPG